MTNNFIYILLISFFSVYSFALENDITVGFNFGPNASTTYNNVEIDAGIAYSRIACDFGIKLNYPLKSFLDFEVEILYAMKGYFRNLEVPDEIQFSAISGYSFYYNAIRDYLQIPFGLKLISPNQKGVRPFLNVSASFAINLLAKDRLLLETERTYIEIENGQYIEKTEYNNYQHYINLKDDNNFYKKYRLIDMPLVLCVGLDFLIRGNTLTIKARYNQGLISFVKSEGGDRDLRYHLSDDHEDGFNSGNNEGYKEIYNTLAFIVGYSFKLRLPSKRY